MCMRHFLMIKRKPQFSVMLKFVLAHSMQENGGVQSLHPSVQHEANYHLMIKKNLRFSAMPESVLAHSIQENGGVQSLHPSVQHEENNDLIITDHKRNTIQISRSCWLCYNARLSLLAEFVVV